MRSKAILILLCVAVVVIGTLAVTQRQYPSANPSGFYGTRGDRASVPVNMADFVDGSPLIIDGTIIDVESIGDVEGWVDGVIATITPPANPMDLDLTHTLPLIEIRVRVDQIYRNRSQDPIEIGSNIIIRAPGANVGACPAQPTFEWPGYYTGDPGAQFLYGLVHTSDNTTWGEDFGSNGRLSLDGPRVMNTDCPPSEVLWTENTEPSAFLAELQTTIASLDSTATP